jgi:hypothetical protein
MKAQTSSPPPVYSRRRPELTPCYEIVRSTLNTFAANRDLEGRPLPKYILEEFDAFLKCGIPAYGFLRLVCDDCEKEKTVAFSCKKRGFCPSCCAKRQAEAATHLVENVLPWAPYRQFVVSFPIPMRYWLNSNKKLFAKIHGIITKQIQAHYINAAKALGIKDPLPGSIGFTQRWGSACNLNPHLHILCLDGVFTMVNDIPKFQNVESLSDSDTEKLLINITTKILKHLRRMGYLNREGDVVDNPLADGLFTDHESLAAATASSIAGKIAFGPNAGRYVTRIGSGFGYGEETPLVKGTRCCSLNGFSLHANTATKTLERDKLYRLIEYIARGPISNKRLEITKAGLVKLQLKTAWSDGTSHLLFTKEEFLEKLTALIPPPRSHLVKWSGIFSPNSPVRPLIVLNPKIKKGFQFKGEDEKSKVKNPAWSKMLAKVFKIDVTLCDHCQGKLRLKAAINDQESIIRYLKHQGIDCEPPARAPAKYKSKGLEFGGDDLPNYDD